MASSAPVPIAKNKTFRLPRDLALRAEARARREHRSLNVVVIELLEGYAGRAGNEFFDELQAINAAAHRRRGGRRLQPARPFTREELHER